MKYLISILSTLIFFSTINIAYGESEPRIEATKAPFYVGRNVMACGNLVEIKKLKKFYYLNLDDYFPRQSISIVISREDYPFFEQRIGNLSSYLEKRFCVRGKIKEYKGNLQIWVSNPLFLRLMK